jgi:hypothetical protein
MIEYGVYLLGVGVTSHLGFNEMPNKILGIKMDIQSLSLSNNTVLLLIYQNFTLVCVEKKIRAH